MRDASTERTGQATLAESQRDDMNQPTAEQRARVQVTRLKEEQKVTKLKKVIETKLKQPEGSKPPRVA